MQIFTGVESASLIAGNYLIVLGLQYVGNSRRERDLRAVLPKLYLARHGRCCKNNGNDQDDFIAVSVPPRGGELRGQAVTRSYPQKSA